MLLLCLQIPQNFFQKPQLKQSLEYISLYFLSFNLNNFLPFPMATSSSAILLKLRLDNFFHAYVTLTCHNHCFLLQKHMVTFNEQRIQCLCPADGIFVTWRDSPFLSHAARTNDNLTASTGKKFRTEFHKQ